MTIGTAESDGMHELHRVVTPFMLADGSLVVPVAGASSVRVFAPDGSFRRSYGREGAGPGEFREISAAWPRGDTIEVFDSDLQRITRFRPDGETEAVTLRSKLRELSASTGPYGAGWVAGGVAAGGPGRRDSIVVHRFDRSGRDLGPVATVAGMRRYEAGKYRGPEPLSPRSVHAVRHDRVYIAETLTPRIRVIGERGEVQALEWRPPPSGPIYQALTVVTDSAAKRADHGEQIAVREQIHAAPVPTQLSDFWQFLVDARGFVWIKPYDPVKNAFALGGKVGQGGRWTILAPDGGPAGSIEMPPEIEPTFIGDSTIVGVGRDEFGVEYVQVYALERR